MSKKTIQLVAIIIATVYALGFAVKKAGMPHPFA